MQRNQNQLTERLWKALARIIDNRYQRQIHFSPAVMAQSLGQEVTTTSKGDLLIPLLIRGDYQGAVRVKDGSSLTAESVFAIRDLLYQLNEVLNNGFGQQWVQVATEPQTYQRFFFNLVGGTFERRRRMAMDLHSTIEVLSFITWQDLIRPSLTYLDLTGLEDTILYVPEYADLKREEQKIILELIQQKSDQTPHLLVGSQTPLWNQIQDDFQTEELKEHFLKSELFVEQMPKEYLLLKEVLAMLVKGDKKPDDIPNGVVRVLRPSD